MAKNLLKENIENTEDNHSIKKRKENVFAGFLSSLFTGTILTRENVIKSIPFLFYLTFLAVLYISNSYFAERTIRNIEKTKNELKELRTEHISVKSELMLKSKQSEIALKLLQNGIRESTIPPKKIFIKKDTVKQISD